MPLMLNGVEAETVMVNGVGVDNVYLNNVEVFVSFAHTHIITVGYWTHPEFYTVAFHGFSAQSGGDLNPRTASGVSTATVSFIHLSPNNNSFYVDVESRPSNADGIRFTFDNGETAKMYWGGNDLPSGTLRDTIYERFHFKEGDQVHVILSLFRDSTGVVN